MIYKPYPIYSNNIVNTPILFYMDLTDKEYLNYKAINEFIAESDMNDICNFEI
jgi:hypothetical protein